MVATALVVAGTLLRQGTYTSVAPSSTLPPPTQEPTISSVTTFDPSGTGNPGENDSLATSAVDGDLSTAWRTETYEAPSFVAPKQGVGLLISLDTTSLINLVTIDSSANGWSGALYPVAAGVVPDPANEEPAATFSDVRDQLSVPLGGARAGRTAAVDHESG